MSYNWLNDFGVEQSGLTLRQIKAHNKRVEENRLIVRERIGKRKYDKIAKAVNKVLGGGNKDE